MSSKLHSLRSTQPSDMASFTTRLGALGLHIHHCLVPISAAPLAAGTILQSLKSLASHPLTTPWQQFTSLVPSLTDMQLWAVPKHKVSPHRKGKRSANKHLRFIPIVSQCSKCERVFPPHAMPSKCEEDECPAFNVRGRPSAVEVTE